MLSNASPCARSLKLRSDVHFAVLYGIVKVVRYEKGRLCERRMRRSSSFCRGRFGGGVLRGYYALCASSIFCFSLRVRVLISWHRRVRTEEQEVDVVKLVLG